MSLILVVEDDVNIGVLLEALLGAEGHDVDRVSTGVDAIAAATNRRPDLAIVDVSLAGDLDGYDVTRWLRSQPATATLPVLMVTARAREEDIAQGLAAGATEYVVKPFEVPDFLTRVSGLLPAR